MLHPAPGVVPADSSNQKAGTCAACGQPVAAGEGYAATFRGRLLRFRCLGCLDSFRREPDRYVSADDHCCATAGFDESPASEWVI